MANFVELNLTQKWEVEEQKTVQFVPSAPTMNYSVSFEGWDYLSSSQSFTLFDLYVNAIDLSDPNGYPLQSFPFTVSPFNDSSGISGEAALTMYVGDELDPKAIEIYRSTDPFSGFIPNPWDPDYDGHFTFDPNQLSFGGIGVGAQEFLTAEIELSGIDHVNDDSAPIQIDATLNKFVEYISLPGTAYVGDTLFLAAEDYNYLKNVYENVVYTWHRNGEIISDTELSAYTIIQEDVGQTISLMVEIQDDYSGSFFIESEGELSVANPTGAILTASKTFDQRAISFPSIGDVALDPVEFGSNYTYNGNFYEDTGAVIWREDGVLYLMGVAGAFDWDESTDIASGTVNGFGLVELDYIPRNFAEAAEQVEDAQNLHWVIENAQINAGDLYETYKTKDKSDELSVVNATFAGNDIFNLSSFDDYALGFSGDDILQGGSGNDTLHGGEGNDTIDGGDGDDTAYIGIDENTLVDFDSVTIGTDGDNLLISGDDIGENIFTNVESFVFNDITMSYAEILSEVSPGVKSIGNASDDTMDGTNGDDTIASKAGDDSISAGAGDDRIAASDGNDTVDGGSGDDMIGGGLGNDSISGGTGHDTIGSGEGNDIVDGGDGNDMVAAGRGDDTVSGGLGDDRLAGSVGEDSINGDEGEDNIGGGYNNDTIHGGTGNDTVGAGQQDDVLYGDEGDDVLNGNWGHDTIYGGDGNDTIAGGDHNDVMTGGNGADVFRFRVFNTDTEDHITDFTRGEDLLEMRGSFAGLNISNHADGLQVEKNGHVIILEDVANITADDFNFV